MQLETHVQPPAGPQPLLLPWVIAAAYVQNLIVTQLQWGGFTLIDLDPRPERHHRPGEFQTQKKEEERLRVERLHSWRV